MAAVAAEVAVAELCIPAQAAAAAAQGHLAALVLPAHLNATTLVNLDRTVVCFWEDLVVVLVRVVEAEMVVQEAI